MRALTKGLIAGVVLLGLATPAATAIAGETGGVAPTIINGQDATEPYSFMASMQGTSGGHFCGGALVRPTWVLTATHCMAGKTPSGVQIRIGSTNRTSGGTVAKVKRWVAQGTADTTLVELTAPVTQTPISVAASVATGSTVRLLGWGCTASPNCGPAPTILKQVDVAVLADSQCGTNQYEICLSNAGGKSACYGDSGGPLLVGTTGNWTIGGDTHGGPSVCGSGTFTYAELPTIRAWIDSVAGPDGGNPGPNPNLALNRPATGSAACNADEAAAKAVNGSVSGGNSDKWCSSAATRTLDVDLGASKALTKLVVKHASAGGESATFNTRAFTLSTSADGSTWTAVATVTANTAGTTEHAVSTSARYIRLTVTNGVQSGSNVARIYEFEAYA
jgi:hypothetical protein